MREMKDSGLAWIGNVPADWGIEKFKHQFALRSERNPGDATILSLYRELGIVPKDSRDDNHNVTSLDTSKYRYVRPGDFVVNKMKAWQGSTAVSDYEGVVSPAYYVYEFRHNDIDRKFFHYLFRSRAYAQQFALLSGGIREGQWDLPADELYNIGIIVPPPAEQSRIATFLDERCGKIDEAVARHKALIEKLDEYRKAVITKAVTKGVNGEREMKESGVDWIGQIPTEWSLIKGRYVYNVLSGYPLDSEKFSMTDGFPMIRIRDITSGEIETYYDGDFPVQYIVTKGDLLVGMDGDFRVRQWDNIDAVLNQRCCKVTEHKYAIRRYLFYVLPLYLKRINDVIFGTTVKHLSVPDMKVAPIPIPSPEEQSEIVAFLDKKCVAIDSAKERHAQLIAKLEEYKKSLIYNAVTGKIEC